MSDTTPSVGDGATIYGYSDRMAYTVIQVSPNKKRIWIQRDKATLLNGFKSGAEDALTFAPGGFFGHTSGTQRYSYEPDPEGEIKVATLREVKCRKGSDWRALPGDAVETRFIWKLSGWPTKTRGGEVTIGIRDEHYDYNF